MHNCIPRSDCIITMQKAASAKKALVFQVKDCLTQSSGIPYGQLPESMQTPFENAKITGLPEEKPNDYLSKTSYFICRGSRRRRVLFAAFYCQNTIKTFPQGRNFLVHPRDGSQRESDGVDLRSTHGC